MTLFPVSNNFQKNLCSLNKRLNSKNIKKLECLRNRNEIIYLSIDPNSWLTADYMKFRLLAVRSLGWLVEIDVEKTKHSAVVFPAIREYFAVYIRINL